MNFESLFENKKNILIFQVLVGIISALISFLLFAKITDTVFENEKIIFDSVLINYIYSFRNVFNTKLMILLSVFGFYGVICISIIISAFLSYKKRYLLSIYFLFTVSSGFLVNFLLKLLIQRQRPNFLPLTIENDFSFPSGHAMVSFIFFITVVYLYYHLTKKKVFSVILLLVFLIITIFIGISRIYLGVHYPSDILGGFIAGFLWFIGLITSKKAFALFKAIQR